MLWKDTLDLITVVHSVDPVVEVSETSRTVFANKKSVVRSEYYQAYSNGLNPTATFDVLAAEYLDEQKLRWEGKDFIIIRTFSRSEDVLELVCQAADDVLTNLARLRDTIEIWGFTLHSSPATGKQVKTEVLLYTVPASIEYASSGSNNELIDSVADVNVSRAKVAIVYKSPVTLDMYVKIAGQRWDIQSIDNVFNRNETLILQIQRRSP